MFKLKLGAVALAFALSTALPVEIPYTAGLVGATAAQAGIFGKIKGAVKTVGSEAKKFATDTAKHAKTSAKIVGGKAKNAAKAVGSEVKNAAKVAGQTIKHDAPIIGGAIKRGTVAVVQAPAKGFCALAGCETDFKGPAIPPNLNKPLPKPPAGRPGSWGGNAGKSAMVGKQGLVARDKSAMRRPVGVKAPNQGIGKPNLGIGRDKSAWGRPVGVSKRHMGRTSMRNVQRTPMRHMMRHGRR